MIKSKKFVLSILMVLSLFIIFHLVVWQFTKKVYPKDYVVGDLARMSYKFDLITERINTNTLEKKHIHFNDYNGEKVDVITIGDSFSNGVAGGINSYYQDYIATKYDLNVLNILNFSEKNSYLNTLYILLENGFFDQVKPKYIILESVQRNIYENIGFEPFYYANSNVDNIVENIKNTKDIYHPKEKYGNKVTIINNLNYNVLINNLRFYIKGYGKHKKYYIEKLERDFFTSKVTNELIFFQDDIVNLKYHTEKNINNLNNNLNNLSKLLKTKGITLYFMPVVDKFTLYRDYLVEKENYPKSDLFDRLEKLNKEYILINTKKILDKELKNNVLDLYFSDDTHWNYKASEAITKNLDLSEVKY